MYLPWARPEKVLAVYFTQGIFYACILEARGGEYLLGVGGADNTEFALSVHRYGLVRELVNR
jgi:hypothetical protein